MIWFISDTHFSHTNIIKYSNRPFNSVHEMNAIMTENWNKCVAPTDSIFHLGDFAFARFDQIKDILKQLNGFKTLILGNHDKEIIRNKHELTGRYLFDSIQNYVEFKYHEYFFCLFHYGQRVWNKSHHGAIQLHGHSHGSLPPFGKSVDVGIDAPFIIPRVAGKNRQPEDYRPVSIVEVIEYMKNRPIEKSDRHGD